MSNSSKLIREPKFSSVSVYRRIEADLRAKVEQGHWPIGAMLPSRKNLAREYGVDERTLQRAIAGLLADGTLRADGGRGTFVTETAAVRKTTGRPARAAATKMVALVQSPPTYPSTQAVLRAVSRTLHEQAIDYRLLLLGIHGDTPEKTIESERHALDVIETEGIAGAILCHSGSRNNLPQIARMVENGIPIVFLDSYPTEMACDHVGVDNAHGAREAVDYLLSLGHHRIAFLTTTEPFSTIDQRLTGYEKAFRSAGIGVSAELIRKLEHSALLNGAGMKREMRSAIDHFRTLKVPPTAMFAVNDFIAKHFIAEAEASGWSVPDEISVIGFDDVDQFSPQPSFLTTIRQPFELTGECAAELLLRNLETPRESRRVFQRIILPTKLVVRSSCRHL